MDEDLIKLEKKIKTKYKNLIPYKVYIPDNRVHQGQLILNVSDLCFKDDCGMMADMEDRMTFINIYYFGDLPKITSSNRILNKMTSTEYCRVMHCLGMELINLPRDMDENNLYFCITQGNSWDVKKEFMSYNMFVFKYDHGFLEYNLYHNDWRVTSERVLAWVKI